MRDLSGCCRDDYIGVMIRRPTPPGSLRKWQADGKRRATAGLAGGLDRAAVGFDVGLDQAEAEAQAALGTAGVGSIKTFPDPGQVFGGDAGARIDERDTGRVHVTRRADANGPLRRRVFDGVVEEIGKDLAQAVARTADGEVLT